MQDLGGGERTTGFELTDGVKMSGGPEICQEYPGTLRRNSMRECREGGLNMNFMESYFCQVSSLSPCLLSILHPYLYPTLSNSVMPNSTTLWTITHQVPLSKGFFRQEYWSGLLFPPTGISNPSPVSPAWQVDAPSLSHQESPISTLDPHCFQQGYGGHLLTRFLASGL